MNKPKLFYELINDVDRELSKYDKLDYQIMAMLWVQGESDSGQKWGPLPSEFTPNIDVLRDPRWGRVGETFGEDPFMVGNLGASMINGFQLNDFTGTNKVIACAKHMIAGSEPINGLNASPMDVSMRTLKEVYLPPYKKAIDAGVYSIMAGNI